MTGAAKILQRLSRPHWFEIIELIKCSQGMSVGELSEAMGMSYMGVKKHCLAMQKLGYLDTWRRPKDVGRPEKLYRLTKRLDPLFSQIDNQMGLAMLDAAAQLDPNAAEKMLFTYYRQHGDDLAPKVAGDSLAEKAAALASLRSEEGRYAEAWESEDGGLWIDEYHNPLEPLFEKYPTLERMEVQMFEKLLGVPVERSVEKTSGLTLVRFELFSR